MPEPTGLDLIDFLDKRFGKDHPRTRLCPGCNRDCATTGITRLAYTYERCSCDLADYEHIIETLWHIECLNKKAPERGVMEILREVVWFLRLRTGRRSLALADRVEAYIKDRS